jgi:hypothetical protein
MPKAAHDKEPTKAPEFQKGVQTFLRTPPQPHKPVAKRKTITKRPSRKATRKKP